MITDENYHSETTHISKSGLDKINISPAHYYYYYLDPNRPIVEEKRKRHELIGDIFHAILMEPQHFSKRYFVTPAKVDRRTKEGREIWFKCAMSAKGKEIVNRDIYDLALWMRDATLRHPIAKHLFKFGKAEEVITFVDPITGLNCKIKPDWQTPDGYVVDLKSTQDASCLLDPETLNTSNQFVGFPKSVYNYRYDVQNAFYSDGIEVAKGKKPKGFLFVAVEKDPPFEVSIYTLSSEKVEDGRRKYRQNLETYKSCLASGIWPGYPKKIITLI